MITPNHRLVHQNRFQDRVTAGSQGSGNQFTCRAECRTDWQKTIMPGVLSKQQKRGVSQYAIVCIVLALFFNCLGVARADQVFRFGTGGSDGTYFPIGSLIAAAINEKRVRTESGEQLLVIPQRSSGSVANLVDMSEGLLEAGLAQADVVNLAFHGEEQFENMSAYRNLRTVGTLYHESVHLVVRADSEINEVSDLRGRRVSVDELGSGTQLDVEPILAAFNLSFEDIQPIYLKPVDSIERMRRGLLDAFFVIAGYPLSGIKKLADDGVGRVISLQGENVEKLTDDYLYFTTQIIPKGIYSNELEIPTLSVPAQIIVREDISEHTIYQITKILWNSDTLNSLASGHSKGSEIEAGKALQGIGIPLHRGAARYYREVGFDLNSVPQ